MYGKNLFLKEFEISTVLYLLYSTATYSTGREISKREKSVCAE